METKNNISFDELKTALGDLGSQPDKFIDRYVAAATKSEKMIFQIESGKELIDYGTYNAERIIYEPKIIYLPTDNRDPAVIGRLLKSFIRLNYPGYVENESNKRIFNYLIGILTGAEKKRGLIIRGPVGSGKTLALMIWVHFRKTMINELIQRPEFSVKSNRRFSYFSPTDLTRLFMKHGFELFDLLAKKPEVLILDDVGVSNVITYYGTAANPIELLIYEWYELSKKYPDREIYLSTNLKTDQLKSSLGERAFSRLCELAAWDPGQLIADDYRLKNPVEKWPEINFYDPIPMPTDSNRRMVF